MTEEAVTKPRATRAKAEPKDAGPTETAEAALPTSIIQIIPRIRAEVGAIAKGQSTKSGPSYSYRSTDDIIDALAPLFNKYGVFTTVNDLEHAMEAVGEPGKRVTTTVIIRKEVRFYGPDGEYVTSTVSGEGADFSDKATNKAGTYAYRVALVQTFTLPTGEKDEGGEYVEKTANAKVNAAIAAAQRPAPTASAPASPLDNLRNAVKAAAGVKGMDSKALNALGSEIAGEGVPVEVWFNDGEVLNKMIQKMNG